MSSLIIATGSNLGDKKENLKRAREELSQVFKLIAQSQVFQSSAVDYFDQPDFFNQVLEFEQPATISALEVLHILLNVEHKLGRTRDIPKGPRSIDIDLLFYGLQEIKSDELEVPHPRLWSRSFVVLPLKQLPFFETLKAKYKFDVTFDTAASPINS